jgi:hypothetical protein
MGFDAIYEIGFSVNAIFCSSPQIIYSSFFLFTTMARPSYASFLPVAARISSKYREMLMKSMSHNICLS